MEKELLIKNLRNYGFSKQILNAFYKVRREDFVPGEMRKHAYEDAPIPIGKGQTISQPYTIAKMLSMLDLKKGQRVLEVGSGCGYVQALLSEITGKDGKVYGIEIIKELAEKSKESLESYKNIEIKNSNGKFGWEEKAPFDRILISAGYRRIPEKLINQLKEDGIIVAPIGTFYEQSLISFRKKSGKLNAEEKIPGFIFVPLTGK